MRERLTVGAEDLIPTMTRKWLALTVWQEGLCLTCKDNASRPACFGYNACILYISSILIECSPGMFVMFME